MMRRSVVSVETLMAEKASVRAEIRSCGAHIATQLSDAVGPARPLLRSNFSFLRYLGMALGMVRLVKTLKRLMGR